MSRYADRTTNPRGVDIRRAPLSRPSKPHRIRCKRDLSIPRSALSSALSINWIHQRLLPTSWRNVRHTICIWTAGGIRFFQMRPSTRAKQISFCKKFSALVPADDPVIIEPVSGAGNFAISVHDGMRYSPKLQQIKRLERNSLANVTGNLQGGIREAQHANTGTGSEAPEIQTASHHELASFAAERNPSRRTSVVTPFWTSPRTAENV
jgi:hypothetical protein